MPTDSIRSELAHRLSPHGSEGARTNLSGVVDLEALRQGRYEDVLAAVDERLATARYSLISMVVAGIYFGLLAGLFLVDFSSWRPIFAWMTPVLLVTVYGVYTTHQTAVQIRDLSETRALLDLMMQQGSPEDETPAR